MSNVPTTESKNTDPATSPQRGYSLWGELKRRKVTRVAITYAVVAWVLMQVTSIVFPQFDIPDWAGRLVILFLLIGFPIALIITWAFELTPDGITTTKHAREKQGEAPVTKSESMKRNGFKFLLATGLPTLIFGSLAVFFYLKSGGKDASESGDKSIAVLPFTAFSTEEEERFFADGLSDTLLHKLAQLSDIRVISRSSSFQYRGDSVDVRKVGEELNVSTVLEGSVQRSGDRLRIIAQLINTSDGGHIWSKTFDRRSEDTFAIHDEIAEAVVDSLRVNTTETEKQRLDYNGTTSVEAYTRLTLLREQSNITEGFNSEPQAFEQQQLKLIAEMDKILEIDPNYAEVYRVKAGMYDGIVFRGAGDSRDYYLRKGFEAVRQAMLLEPMNPHNFVIYADLSRRSGDPVTAETFARLALSELPNDKEAVLVLSLSLFQQLKNPRECLALVEKEESLGADEFTWRRKRMALGLLGRHEEALQIALDKLRGPELTQIAAPDYIFTQSGVLGRHSEAMKELLLFRNRIGDSISSTFWKAWQNLLSNVDLDQEIQKLLDQNPGNGGSEMLQALLLWSQGKHQETIGWLDKIGWDWHHLRAMNLLMLGDFAAAADNLTLEKENLESRHGKHPYLANADDFPPALRLVTCFRKTGEDEAAEKLLREVNQFANSRTVDGYSPSLGYEICIYHLLNGRKKQALEEMEKRIYLTDENFVPLGQFRSFSSPMFEDLHHDSDFREMVAEYERRRSASAESISAMIKAAGY